MHPIVTVFICVSGSGLRHDEQAHTQLAKLEVGTCLLAHEDVPLLHFYHLLPCPLPLNVLTFPHSNAALVVWCSRRPSLIIFVLDAFTDGH